MPTKCLCLVLPVLIFAAFVRADDNTTIKNDTPPISIHLEAHPLEVFAEMNKQTGVTIQPWPENLWEQYKNNQNPPATLISIDADNKPFWVVMQQICDAAKLTPAAMGEGGVISLQWQSGNPIFGKRPIFAGPSATIIADSIERHHTVNLDAETPQATRSCGVHFTAYIDPRLRVLKYRTEPTLETATDENGASLAAEKTVSQPQMQQLQHNWQVQNLFAPLDYDPAKSKKLAALKGAVRVSVAAETEKFELTDLASAQGTQKEIAGRTITVEEVKDENNSINVRLSVVRTDAPPEQFREMVQGLYQAINLQSADGKRRNNGGGGGGDDKKITYSVQASYSNDNEKPVKLLWEMPTKIEEIDLPFEFKDLPLP